MKLSGTCTTTYGYATSSYIISPNYPQNYGPDEYCSWTITALGERTIALNFTDFDIEKPYDELKVYNESSDIGVPMIILSGRSIPSQTIFGGKDMYLDFTSDESGSRKGFQILVEAFGRYMKGLL